MQRKPLSLAFGLSLLSLNATAVELTPVVVTADLREATEAEIAASVSIEDEAALQAKGATHFDDVILSLPNLNFAGQSSRPRHIQIRGIGERDEYTGAPNASVGFAIDDIDFSGIGMAGNLFDIQQVEVLRGPQGTRYGANALGGLINIRSNEPSKMQENLLELSAGEDGFQEIGLMTSGPFLKADNSPLYRLSVFKHDSNGFRDNATLNRDDTNGRDELTVRGKLRFTPSATSLVDLTLLHADLDNGYDAWSLDNSYTTLSDEPGDDIQKSDAAAIKIKLSGHSVFDFTSTTTASKTDSTYSYDGDWVFVGYHPDEYVYFFENDKERDSFSQELRFVSKPDGRLFNGSTDWLFGLYALNFDEHNQTTDNYGTNAITDYSATNVAAFGQLDYHLSQKTTLSTGARLENRSADFENNNGETFSPNDDMFGGHMTITHAYTDQHRVYAAVTQGYKAGGFNADLPADADPRLTKFDMETALNYEAGVKSFFNEGSIKTNVSVFYMERDKPQFDGYTYVGANYIYFTENFDSATNYGLEAELDWQASANWNLFGSLGLLESDVSGQSLVEVFRVDGREQAHAPGYQFNLGAQYRNGLGWFARAEARGMDEFFFSNSHDANSEAYTLYNARLGYEAGMWEAYLWGKNLSDEKYATRGFFFANDPAKGYIEEAFTRLGDRRMLGATVRVRF